jgi:hypothetical protein
MKRWYLAVVLAIFPLVLVAGLCLLSARMTELQRAWAPHNIKPNSAEELAVTISAFWTVHGWTVAAVMVLVGFGLAVAVGLAKRTNPQEEISFKEFMRRSRFHALWFCLLYQVFASGFSLNYLLYDPHDEFLEWEVGFINQVDKGIIADRRVEYDKRDAIAQGFQQGYMIAVILHGVGFLLWVVAILWASKAPNGRSVLSGNKHTEPLDPP